MLEKLSTLAYLYDFYENLLTEKQKRIFKLYYFHDLSLGEIAEECEISRQAVYDLLKRTEELLNEYEKKLNLYEKFIHQKKHLEKLKKILLDLNEVCPKDNVLNAIRCVDDLINLNNK